MTSIDSLESRANLTDSCSEFCRFDRERKKVALTCLSGLSQGLEACLASLLVSASLRCFNALDLLASDIVVIDFEHVEVLLLVL